MCQTRTTFRWSFCSESLDRRSAAPTSCPATRCQSAMAGEQCSGGCRGGFFRHTTSRPVPAENAAHASPSAASRSISGPALDRPKLVCYFTARFKMQHPRQLELRVRTWGGRRPGSGRKPAPGRRVVPHRRRAPHDPRCPVHVTLRAMAGLRSLREEKLCAAIRRAFGAASRHGFRLLQFSVQSDHIHLLVEADMPTRLARGVQGLAIRVARAVNRVLRRRGRVWVGRYHARLLPTPREVRNALIYVLQNWRKHVAGAVGVDPCSSASAFTGWRTVPPGVFAVAPVASARTWLASVGWQRYGLLDVREGPRGAPRRR